MIHIVLWGKWDLSSSEEGKEEPSRHLREEHSKWRAQHMQRPWGRSVPGTLEEACMAEAQ